jgi:3',5'-cyclic AMP phosphodiesterase CpdA
MNPALLDPLRAAVGELDPHVVVVSGDLTQRARRWQFEQARDFLSTLPSPRIVVPGNHDLPLFSPVGRLLGLRAYRELITDDLAPFYADGEIAILGLNTARPLAVSGGRISRSQLRLVRDRMCGAGEHVVKILVTHHPFDLPVHSHHKTIVGGAAAAIRAMADCGVDMILSGHLHVIHTAHSSERFDVRGHSALLVHAGTALSTRGRGESNSFNFLRIDGRRIGIEGRRWEPETASFYAAAADQYEKAPEGWRSATV